MLLEFEDQNINVKSRSIFGAPEIPGMARLLIKLKLVNDEKMAYKILVAISVICFTTAIGLLVYYFKIP